MKAKIIFHTCVGEIEYTLLESGELSIHFAEPALFSAGNTGDAKLICFSPDDTQRYVKANAALALLSFYFNEPNEFANLINRTLNNR